MGVVKEDFLRDSNDANCILDWRKYICNYQRVRQPENGLFGGMGVRFGQTNMKVHRLTTLLKLGKAHICGEDIDKENEEKMEKILICQNEIDLDEANAFAVEYDCKIIGESWMMQCIYPTQEGQNKQNLCVMKKRKEYVNYYKMDPITKPAEFVDFKIATRPSNMRTNRKRKRLEESISASPK